jgi:alkylation response protein AidB-like acyl-CoA dehydrogenase
MAPVSLDYYNVEELLTEEERAARDRARHFVQEEVMTEIVPCFRAAKFPEHLTPRMGALGFYAPYLKEHGCAGLSYTAHAGCRDWSRANASVVSR